MKSHFSRLTALALLVMFFQTVTTFAVAPPQLVKDINTSPNTAGINPQNFCTVGNIVFFTATDITHGTELWKTDGTEAGTVLVKDINCGIYGSNIAELKAMGGVLYFAASDGVTGTELWKSDGTEAGTVLVKDMTSNPSPNLIGNSGPASFTVAGNVIYFINTSPFGSGGLWRSDGTEAGTIQIKDYASNPAILKAIGNTLYFRASDATNGGELWKTDGTVAGTVLVKDIYSGNNSSNPTIPTIIGNTFYFSANDGINGTELWKSDGTPEGTVLIKDIRVGGNSSNPILACQLDNILYFIANNSTNGTELWKSDGTPGGTVLVKDIYSGSNSSNPSTPVVIGNTLYFSANDGINGTELWKSDGTPEGTVLVKDIYSGLNNSSPTNLTAFGNTLYFTATNGSNGVELWKSDGTPGGTVMVEDLFTGSGSSNPAKLMVVGSTLYFYASNTPGIKMWKINGESGDINLVKDGNGVSRFLGLWPASAMVGVGNNTVDYGGALALISWAAVGETLYLGAPNSTVTPRGTELWKTNGTDAGTVLIKGIYNGTNPSAYDPSYPGDKTYLTFSTYPTAVGNDLYFAAYDTTNGKILRKSDGTFNGTAIVKAANNAILMDGPPPPVMTAFGGTLFFQSSDPINGTELWKSDGTGTEAVLVKDIVAGNLSSYPDNLTVMGNALFFLTKNGAGGTELWKSDGTAVGTVMVKSIINESGYAILTGVSSPMAVMGNTLYFYVYDPVSGSQLWKSDGTGLGTVLVKNTGVSHLTVIGNTLYFTGSDATNGEELWKSDGTAAGTVMVKDINSGAANSSTSEMVVVGTNLFFSANDGINGTQLWKSDGTPTGTSIVKLIGGIYSPGPGKLTVIGNTLYFVIDDGIHGQELWKSNGTDAGTVLVKDIFDGIIGSYSNQSAFASSPVAVGNTLYFQANDGIHGQELWKSDGTAAGTVLAADITGDTGGSSPANLRLVGNQLYFTATTDAYGSELYVYTTPLPGVKTLVTTNTSPTGGTLNGTVNPNGAITTAQFEYGTTTSYGSTVAVTISPNNDSADHSVSATLTGLTPNMLYHFRLKATNVEGNAYTSDSTFVAALSSEARLSGLTLSSGTLSPTFSSNTTGYTVTVANGITSLSATPTVLESHATVTVNNVAVTSGTASNPINISVGSNLITVVGTAQNGVNTKSYTITVNRQTPYQTWIDSLTGASGSLPLSDIEHDGLVNLLEYAFGTNPSENNPGAMSVINSTTITPGTPKAIESGVMKALFIRRKDWAASGLTYTVQFSPNLTLWENSVTVPTVVADDGTLQAVTVPFPALINGEPVRFFRVQVNGQ